MPRGVPNSRVAIIIPTFRRPDALVLALESALTQKPPHTHVQVIVVDNDVYGSARTVCEGRARVTYVREPQPGVSNARNAGLAAAAAMKARFIFFLDDDMQAQRGCLETLLAAANSYQAGVCFASVTARMPNDSAISDYMKPFFSRSYDQAAGLTDKAMGAGGSLFDLSRLALPTPAFDPKCNEVGGEDDVLLTHLSENGVQFAWVPSAQTVEDVPEHRASLSYLWTRNFAFGQGPTQIAADRGDRKGVAKWMAVGVAQVLLRLPVWGLYRVLGVPRLAHAHAQLAQGMGKIFWWDSFRAKLYGDPGQKRVTSKQSAA